MANVRWVGGAPAVKQLTTITIANTWATNDTVSVTIANKTLTVTIGSAFTTADVAAALAAAINAADATTGLVGNETRNFGGGEIPEFADVVADAWVSGSVVYVRSAVAGTPFTMTASESTAGTGTATAATPTAATGPNHADNPDNYAGGALPATNDTLFFDQGEVDCLHGLGYFRTNTIELALVFSNDWTGRLGLPAVNEAGYPEYRQRYFYAHGTKTTRLVAGSQGNINGGAIHLDFQACNHTINIEAARNANLSEPSLFIAGSDGSGLPTTIKAGNVSIEPEDSGTSTPFDIAGLYCGVIGASNADLVVTVGRRVTSGASTTIILNSGTLTFNGLSITATSAIEIHGGTVVAIGATELSQFPDFNIRNGGTLKPIYGAECGAVEVFSGGTLDCRETLFAFATSNGATAHPGATVRDPGGNFLFCAATALLTLPGGRLNDITHELPANRIVDMTASA